LCFFVLTVVLPIGVEGATILVPKPFTGNGTHLSARASSAVVFESGQVVWDGHKLSPQRVAGIVSAEDRSEGVSFRLMWCARGWGAVVRPYHNPTDRLPSQAAVQHRSAETAAVCKDVDLIYNIRSCMPPREKNCFFMNITGAGKRWGQNICRTGTSMYEELSAWLVVQLLCRPMYTS
jgi:hypothetical protein